MRGSARRWERRAAVALAAFLSSELIAADRPLSAERSLVAPTASSRDAGGGLAIHSSAAATDALPSLLGAYSLLVVLHDDTSDRADGESVEASNTRAAPATLPSRAVFSLLPPPRQDVSGLAVAQRLWSVLVDRGRSAVPTAISGAASFDVFGAIGRPVGLVGSSVRREALVVVRNVLVVGTDSRGQVGPSPGESDHGSHDAFVVWLPNTGLALTGGVAWLRRTSDTKRRRGAYASVQLTY